MKVFNLPDLGEGLPDAEIREWLIKEGDEVKIDQPIVSMETAKALVDVPSPYEGRIVKLYGKEGDIIKTGSPLVGFEMTGEVQEPTRGHQDSGTVVGNIEVGDRVLRESATGVEPRLSVGAVKITPAVRALARELQVDLSTITPTGPHGTITVQDVKQAGEKSAVQEGYEQLHGPRRAMAINMAQAHASVVPITLVDDADIQNFSANEDITLRIIRAIIAACKEEPGLNAHFDGKNLAKKVFSEINLGVAVDTNKGLYVPVIKEIGSLSDEKLRSSIEEFKALAKKQEFPREMLHDATITLSNFGVFVGKYANPIVVPPMVAIIGVGKLRDAVVAVKGKVEIHPILPISLTFDHRAITGGEAARFLAALIADLQL